MPLKLYQRGKIWHYRERLPDGDYAALVKQRTKTSPRARLPRSKPSTGNIVLMDRKRS